jgi:glycosyltransferase involved in cell wall biosynthesis
MAELARRTLGHLRRGRLATYGVGRDRLPIDAYRPGRSEPGYVFFTAWAWQKHPEVNESRGRFIRAVRSGPGVRFEGGFVPRPHDDVANVRGLTGPGPFTLREFVERTSRSAVAFQSPAVHGCLGWKCGEFLALGKAIVSTGVPQRLPAPLRHGEEIWYVDDDVDAIRAAVQRIATDTDLRSHLERGARSYYDTWLTPAVVIERLLARRS